MTEPKIYAKEPAKITLKKETLYSYCTCGYSKKSPLCDGEHKTVAPEFKSLKFSVDNDSEVWLCQCKQTKNPPYCDGSHKEL